MTHPLIQFLLRPSVGYGLLAAAAVTVALAGVLLVLPRNSAPEPRRSAPPLVVALAAPVEPDVEPGATMEVGALNTGFDRTALERATAIDAEAGLSGVVPAGLEAGPDEAPRMPRPTPVARDPTPMQAYRAVVEGGRRTDELDDGSSAFGFDRPRPDFAAERAARWAARDARATAADAGPVAYLDVLKPSSE